jgi:hypothetical protein
MFLTRPTFRVFAPFKIHVYSDKWNAHTFIIHLCAGEGVFRWEGTVVEKFENHCSTAKSSLFLTLLVVSVLCNPTEFQMLNFGHNKDYNVLYMSLTYIYAYNLNESLTSLHKYLMFLGNVLVPPSL